MLLRCSITATALSETVMGAMPDGPPKHFCMPVVAMSMPHSSTLRSLPTIDAVASVYNRAPYLWQMSPRPSSGWHMVVEVSPCTVATSLGFTSMMACSICSSGNTSPHGRSMTCTSASQRSAISLSSMPKRPAQQTSTGSPGAITDTNAASMAEREVPSTTMV